MKLILYAIFLLLIPCPNETIHMIAFVVAVVISVVGLFKEEKL